MTQIAALPTLDVYIAFSPLAGGTTISTANAASPSFFRYK